MSTLEAPAADVAAYAAAVRRALADLTPDQVDDLTDDLEVALADALADDHRAAGGASLPAMFGTPQKYAAELRAAAGLPAAGPGARTSIGASALAATTSWVRESVDPLREQPWWPPFSGFMRSLAPVWWALRAWIMFALLFGGLFGVSLRSAMSWPFFLAVLIVSVQWGRGFWRSPTVLRWAWRATSVVAIVVLPFVAATSGGTGGSDGGEPYYESPSNDVYVGGRPAGNLFVYDASGVPVPGAQVFDDQGQPVLVGDDGSETGWTDQDGNWVDAAPAVSADGRTHWNAYPLRGVSTSPDPDAPIDDPAPVVAPAWPFAKAGAILLPPELTTPSAAPSPNPSGDPGAVAPQTTPSQPAASDPASPRSAEPSSASAPAATPAG